MSTNTKRINFPETVPLAQWDDGSIRVGGTRITLDTIVHRFQVGDTPEEIQDGFPSLTLAQINETIAWYLNHKEGDEYLTERDREAEKILRELESDPENQARRKELHRRIAERRKTGQLTRT
ncbi:MAG TPA: DUF433 domain-containing protein [Pyrinomonadaceae bacterium]